MGGGGFGVQTGHLTRNDREPYPETTERENPQQNQVAYDHLLGPAPRAADVDDCLERANAQYMNKGSQFMRDGRGYSCQYAQIYFQRLMMQKRVLRERAAVRWPGVPVVNILELKGGEDCCVIGTIFKDMKLKPSIMNEYSSDPVTAPAVAGAKLTDPSDTVVMEDEGARMTLSSTDGSHDDLYGIVTGVIAAVRGKDNDGVFEVEEVLFPGMAPQAPLPQRDDDMYVAILSGLGMGKERGEAEAPLQLQLASDYLVGMLGSRRDQEAAARVARVVVAGGLLGDSRSLGILGSRAAPRSKSPGIGPVKDMDLWLTQLAAGVPVDVMPGAADPATASLPQQPMHRCLLPGSAAFPTVTRATNPHAFEVGGVSFLGSSGQTVEDIYRFTPCEDRVDIMAATLRWRHLSPTSPDTLPTFPFSDRDPFVIQETPHCYFAGNQPEFATRVVTGEDGQQVRLVCVPRFCETGEVVLVNLRNLECRCLHFDSRLMRDD